MDTMTASSSRSSQPPPAASASEPLPSSTTTTRGRRNKINGIVNIPTTTTKPGKRKEPPSTWTAPSSMSIPMSMSIPAPASPTSPPSCKKLRSKSSIKMVNTQAQEDPEPESEYILGLKLFGSPGHGHYNDNNSGKYIASPPSCKKLKLKSSMKMTTTTTQEDPDSEIPESEYILGLKLFCSNSNGHYNDTVSGKGKYKDNYTDTVSGKGKSKGSLASLSPSSSSSNQSPPTTESSEFNLDDLITYQDNYNDTDTDSISSSDGINEYHFQNLITFQDDHKSSRTRTTTNSTTTSTDGPNLPIYFHFGSKSVNDANNNIEKVIKSEILPLPPSEPEPEVKEEDEIDIDNMILNTMVNSNSNGNTNGEFDWLNLDFLLGKDSEGSPKNKNENEKKSSKSISMSSTKKVKSPPPTTTTTTTTDTPALIPSTIKIKKEKDTKEKEGVKLNNITVSEITKRILCEDFKSSRIKLTTPGLGVKEEIIETLDSPGEDVKPVIIQRNINNVNDNVNEPRQVKNNHWSNEETGEFYKSLQIVGSDFETISSKYLPHRSRKEIKAKFKKEEKINPALIGCALDAKLNFQNVLDVLDDKTKLKELIKNEFCRQSKTTTSTNRPTSFTSLLQQKPKLISDYSWGSAVKRHQFFESRHRHLLSSNLNTEVKEEVDANLQIANLVPSKDSFFGIIPLKSGSRSKRSIFSIDKIPSLRPKANKLSKDWGGLPDWMLKNAGLDDLVGVTPQELRARNEIHIKVEENDELEIENSTLDVHQNQKFKLDDDDNWNSNAQEDQDPSSTKEIPMVLPIKIKENGEMPSMPDLF